jgi:hypothetical protein
MDDTHFGCKLRQEERFLNRRISSPNYNNAFASEEVTITGRAA